MTSLQLAPLTDPYDAAAARSLARKYRAAGRTGPRRDIRGSAKNLNVLVILAAVAIVVLVVVASLLVRALNGGRSVSVPPVWGSIILWSAIIALVVVIIVAAVRPASRAAQARAPADSDTLR